MSKMISGMTIRGLLCLVSFVFLFIPELYSQREWTNTGSDNNTIHSLGNGKMLVYEQGPDIVTLYPGPFSTPPLFQFLVDEERIIKAVSSREEGTAIWTHNISGRKRDKSRMVDFVDIEMPVFTRKMDLHEDMKFRLKLNAEVTVLGVTVDDDHGQMLLMTEPGANIYQKYVYPKPLYHQIVWKGRVQVTKSDDDPGDYIFDIAKGESFLYFVGGPEYPEVVLNSDEVFEGDYDNSLRKTRKGWQDFTSRRTDFEKQFSGDVPMKSKLLQTIDDVAVMIKTQQAAEGAVIAGYPYPLGYVRDQYGVSRALLKLGLQEEAKNILDFYWKTWKRAGKLHCAQGIGVDGIFHIHENDEVESPGYLIIQAFDYLKNSGDMEYLRTIYPMLEWCWEVQKKHLAGGMLPFNGDETYVAGGILPRSALNDGSTEATMLFIDGGKLFLDWVEKENLWTTRRILLDREILATTKDSFRDNFWINNELITNQPARLNYTAPPAFRHGVCERGGPKCLVYGKIGLGGIDWTEKDRNNRYQCATCIDLGPLEKVEPKIYNLISVSLIPLYFGSELISKEELQPAVEKVYNEYSKTGILTSQITESGAPDNDRSVGYDYGLVLNALLETDTDGADEIYTQTLNIADDIGAWSEYYINDTPQGTRCRPWESGINLEALIDYAILYPDNK